MQRGIGDPETSATLLGLTLFAVAICGAAARAERRTFPDLATARATWPGPLGAAVAVAALATACRPAGEAAAGGVACIALVAAAPADFRTGLLFDDVTAPAVLAVVTLAACFGRLDLALAGVVLVAGFFLAIVVVSRGAWMGLGDVKAIFALAAAFGPIESTLAVFVACLSGIALAVARPALVAERRLPFGPHLALGGCATLTAGPFVERAWMHLT